MTTSVLPYTTVLFNENLPSTTKPEVFKRYAQVYDALYQDKDYQAECDFLEDIFRQYRSDTVTNVLDLGCGSGGHALALARRGYSISGVDQSPEMVDLARQKAAQAGLQSRLDFTVADIAAASLDKMYDAAICMFAVLNYQTTNQAIQSTLTNARRHLQPGGLFIFDFWYGPAVLKQRPSSRIKVVNAADTQIIRLAEPTLDVNCNTVSVDYHLLLFENKILVEEIKET
ncbi:MAG: class I SAM-dependent methyltransferase, partial [Anaerolineae bacterium]|nr:class I SAM-dependent methyltransferase [Anaerolineae bacterium]